MNRVDYIQSTTERAFQISESPKIILTKEVVNQSNVELKASNIKHASRRTIYEEDPDNFSFEEIHARYTINASKRHIPKKTNVQISKNEAIETIGEIKDDKHEDIISPEKNGKDGRINLSAPQNEESCKSTAFFY